MAVSRGVSFGYWAVAAALAVAAGVGVAVWHGPSTVEVPAQPQHGIGTPDAPIAAPPTLAAAPAALQSALPPATQTESPPPGVSAQDWRTLQHELAQRPEELRRVADYFVFADQVQRFRALGNTPAAERRALARLIDDGLDQRLRQREVNAAEARLIKIAVLDVLVEADGPRRQALAVWEAGVGSAPRPIDVASAAARNTEFQRRQAAILAAWSATPPEQRDPRALEAELDSLRRSSFTPPR
jgi:hypothetical protein